MFTLIHSRPAGQVVSRSLPTLVVSLLIAEFFYKFHSFTLECLAFLATWYVPESLVQGVAGVVNKGGDRG